MSELIINIEAEVNPTEDPEKVKMSIRNLFTPISIEPIIQNQGSLILARAKGKEGLMRFYTLLRQEMILAAARRVLIKGLSKETLVFHLNKQAAYMGRVSFCEPVGESPLGPIKVKIQGDDCKALLEWLVPRTN